MENNDYPEYLTVISRETWGAKPPQELEEDDALTPLKAPISWVHYNDTQTSMCDNLEQCKRILQGIQISQMDGGWPDITYNFMIGTSGEVYVGRGWHHKPNAIQLEILDDAIDIAFIGNFERSAPHPCMLKAAEELIYHGIITSKINMSYNFEEHQDVHMAEYSNSQVK